MSIALLVLALVWKGGHLSDEYAQINRYPDVEIPTLSALHQSWSVRITAASWSKTLAPAPGDIAPIPVVAAEPEPAEPEPVEAAPRYVPAGPQYRGWATHYGESFTGGVLACGTGYYHPSNETILAVGPTRDREWPCGTLLRVCGPAGCAVVVRKDSCPGCGPGVLDLSEAGNELVCGVPPHTCRVSMQAVELDFDEATLMGTRR